MTRHICRDIRLSPRVRPVLFREVCVCYAGTERKVFPLALSPSAHAAAAAAIRARQALRAALTGARPVQRSMQKSVHGLRLQAPPPCIGITFRGTGMAQNR